MRYKTLVSQKLENLSNSINTLDSVIRQNQPREKYEQWLSLIKEKLEEIQTLINSEPEQREGTW